MDPAKYDDHDDHDDDDDDDDDDDTDRSLTNQLIKALGI